MVLSIKFFCSFKIVFPKNRLSNTLQKPIVDRLGEAYDSQEKVQQSLFSYRYQWIHLF